MCVYHQVMKSDVDSHIPEKNPVFPRCQLSAKCPGEKKKVPHLTYSMNVNGAKEPFSYFIIDMDPYMISSSPGICCLLYMPRIFCTIDTSAYLLFQFLELPVLVLMVDHLSPLVSSVEQLYQLTETTGRRGG